MGVQDSLLPPILDKAKSSAGFSGSRRRASICSCSALLGSRAPTAAGGRAQVAVSSRSWGPKKSATPMLAFWMVCRARSMSTALVFQPIKAKSQVLGS